MAEFSLAVTEGLLEEPVVRKVLSDLGVLAPGLRVIVKGGRTAFWDDVRRYDRAAGYLGPILGLADLESFPCPSGLIAQHLPQGRQDLFILRVAERMLESWLLADSEAMAGFLRVSAKSLPRDPERESHPKQTLVNLARRSRVRRVRDDLVPEEGSIGVVGRGYVPCMTEFVEHHWRPQVAANRSESLKRAIAAIKKAAER
jgi:hypothetical protein